MTSKDFSAHLANRAQAHALVCNDHAQKVAAGRAGGKIGGPARAEALSAERKSSIATKAANTRWGNR